MKYIFIIFFLTLILILIQGSLQSIEYKVQLEEVRSLNQLEELEKKSRERAFLNPFFIAFSQTPYCEKAYNLEKHLWSIQQRNCTRVYYNLDVDWLWLQEREF